MTEDKAPEIPVLVLTVQELLAQVALEVGAVGKNARMDSPAGNYNYRSIDDLVNAVHDPLARNSVIFAPHDVRVISEDKGTTRSGKTQYHCRAVVTYRAYGPKGDYIEAAILSEAIDSSDKLSSKLMSQAYKYALAQVLSIPFMDDQDAERPDAIVAPARPEMTAEQAIASIEESAKTLGKTVAEVTNKVREQHGGLGPDELLEMSTADLAAFAEQLRRYAEKNRSK